MRTTLFSIATAGALLVCAVAAPEASAQKRWGKGSGYYYGPGYGYNYPGYYGYNSGYYGSGISFGGKNWGVTIGSPGAYYGSNYYRSSYPYSYYYPSSTYYGYSSSSYYYSNPSYQSGYYTPGQYQPQPTGPVEEVVMQGNQFKPAVMNIKLGTTVRWTNNDQSRHSLAQPHFQWSSPDLGQGETYSWTFAEPGSYKLQCGFHPNMKMTINVQ